MDDFTPSRRELLRNCFAVPAVAALLPACWPAIARGDEMPAVEPAMARSELIDVAQLDRDRVLVDATRYLSEAPVTITAFRCSRSHGGVHDFYSEGDYWWPNPKDPAGPYVQRDGMTNPDNFVAHRHAMIRMSIHVATLTAAHRLSGDEHFARHALEHLRAWFVDEPTRMNPSLRYAQAIQGIATGRGIGIIDTIHLIEPARAASLLQQARLLRGDELKCVQQWFIDYLRWLTTDKYGLDEMNAKNNHGTCWAMQVAAFASFVGDEQKRAMCRDRFKQVLLPDQMAADGSFPRELKRTKPYGYSLFNLDTMAALCQLLSTPTEDLWRFTTPDGRGLQKGVEFMDPFIQDKPAWLAAGHRKDVMYWEFWPVRSPALLFAGVAYREPKYLELWKRLNANPTNDEILRNLPIRTPTLWVE